MEKCFIKSLFVLLFMATSCNSIDDIDEVSSATDLVGSWSNSYEQTQGIITFTYTFNGDSSFVYKVDFYGFNGEPKTELTDSSENLGIFEVEGDSLFLKHSENEEALKSKFWVKNDVLHLEYITYPADAPVLTQMEYNRVD